MIGEKTGAVVEEQDEVGGPDPDPHFEPIISLEPVNTKTLEEDEEEMIKLRAKLFRYDTTSEPREWKERGTGDVKILRHKQSGTCRLLMRRDKTLKICANHYIQPHFELKPNCGSDRAWVWSTPADFADEEPKEELLAIRFATADFAQDFKKAFYEARDIMAKKLGKDKSSAKKSETSDAASDKVSKENKKEEEKSTTTGKQSESAKSSKEKDSSGVPTKAAAASEEVGRIASDVEKLSVKDSGDSNSKKE